MWTLTSNRDIANNEEGASVTSTVVYQQGRLGVIEPEGMTSKVRHVELLL
jgi:hypothetical protein